MDDNLFLALGYDTLPLSLPLAIRLPREPQCTVTQIKSHSADVKSIELITTRDIQSAATENTRESV